MGRETTVVEEGDEAEVGLNHKPYTLNLEPCTLNPKP